MPRRRREITDRPWAVVAPLLPGQATDCGVPAQGNRPFFNAGVWLMRTGRPWADLPERFGKCKSVCRRFRRGAPKGVGENVFEAPKAPALEGSRRDSTVVRAHQQSAGQKSAAETERRGRSRGGLGPNLHACVAALGNAVRRMTTSGPADESDATRPYCAEKGIEAVIPSYPGRTEARPLDEELCRDRHKVERFLAASGSTAARPPATKTPSSPSWRSGLSQPLWIGLAD